MKKIVKIVLIVAAVALLYHGISFFREYTGNASGNGKMVTVEIPQGSSEKSIARILKTNGLIKYTTVFSLKMKNPEYSGKLNFGTYRLNDKMTVDEIIKNLMKVNVDGAGDIKVTIPEGYSAEMIAAKLEQKKIVSANDFLYELKNGKFDYWFLREIPDKEGEKYKLQGYLFPSTYMFNKGESAHTVIEKFLSQFEKEYLQITDDNTNLPMYDIVTVASLIEREAQIESERAKIAGVIYNRIDKKMRLQIDASVVYIITDGMYDVKKVYYKDLKKDSPYNTYKNIGLPVGAICSPGASSLKAAVNPEKHKYLFYHTDKKKNDGSHIFSETYNAHLKK